MNASTSHPTTKRESVLTASFLRRTRRLARSEDGAALVEFTLVVPILVVLVMGILWFGRALNYGIDETHLANEAARYATVNKNPGPAATLQESVRGQADSSELKNGGTSSVPSPGQLCIDFPNGTSNVGDPVKVTMSVNFNWLPILDLPVTQTTIRSSAVMRLEAPPTNYSAGCA
jgi:Flp pilus assembly protein TadG